jgi:hypothetical protein
MIHIIFTKLNHHSMFVNVRRLKSAINVLFTAVALISLVTLNACKEEEEPTPPPAVIGSADVNGSFTTYTRSTFKVTPTTDGRIKNEITISRSDNSQIIISFIGSELGEFELPNADTLNRCRYVDASDRVFKSDTGLIVINDYYVKNGVVTCSGGFSFEGDFINPTTLVTTNVDITNGGFVNIKSN